MCFSYHMRPWASAFGRNRQLLHVAVRPPAGQSATGSFVDFGSPGLHGALAMAGLACDGDHLEGACAVEQQDEAIVATAWLIGSGSALLCSRRWFEARRLLWALAGLCASH